jgi:aspartate dehydrogenase
MTKKNSLSQLRIAIGGLGAVGLDVARRIDAGIPGLQLQAVSALNRRRAEERLKEFHHQPIPVLPLPELAKTADVVVECAPSVVFRQVAESAIQLGRILIPISVGGLIDNWDLVEKATETGARINVPTGALVGLDAVRAVAQGTISRVTIITRKPPAGLAGSSYLIDNNIFVEGITKPKKVFEGTARNGVAAFPANVNVAAALGLAGIGPDQTILEIWADPSIDRNTHSIQVEANSARMELKIENVPSKENPRTGRIVALSIIAALRRLVDPLTIGS